MKINAVAYTQILEDYYIPQSAAVGPYWIFQQDNAPAHTAKTTMNWIKEQGIRIIKWPSKSPDLNPLDFSIWSMLEQKVNDIMGETRSRLSLS